jgi:hypothetical protein
LTGLVLHPEILEIADEIAKGVSILDPSWPSKLVCKNLHTSYKNRNNNYKLCKTE